MKGRKEIQNWAGPQLLVNLGRSWELSEGVNKSPESWSVSHSTDKPAHHTLSAKSTGYFV